MAVDTKAYRKALWNTSRTMYAEFKARMEECLESGMVQRVAELTAMEEFPLPVGAESAIKKLTPDQQAALRKSEAKAFVAPGKMDEESVDDMEYGDQDFVGRKTTLRDCAEWVASNIYNKDAKVEDAPDAVAWNLLADARADAEFRRRVFWDKIYLKVVGANEDADKKRDDGSELVSTIRDLLQIRDSVSAKEAG